MPDFQRLHYKTILALKESNIIAREMKFNYVGTEHLLVSCIAHLKFFDKLCLRMQGISFEKIKEQLRQLVMIEGEREILNSEIPFTPQAKIAIEAVCQLNRSQENSLTRYLKSTILLDGELPILLALSHLTITTSSYMLF